MTHFRAVFYPQEGESHSPLDILLSLDLTRRVAIMKRLEDFEKLEYQYWPHSWSKKHTGDICQFTSGAYRVMFVLDAPYLVVLHIFRKKNKKTDKRELSRAIANYEDYLTVTRGQEQ